VKYLNKFKLLEQLIGNTPLLKVTYKYKGNLNALYAKAEQYNFTGSIKDRMALHVLRQAYMKGDFRQDSIIIEATSGNAGIAFAGIGSALGNQVKIYMPNWLSQERISMIKSFGAEVELVSHEQGGFLGCIRMTQEVAAHNSKVFLTRQFDNYNNTAAHVATTAPEIFRQLSSIGVTPDVFVAGVGTGGTVMGVGQFLQSVYPQIKVHPLEPTNSPTLSTGYKVGSHRIQGISDEFIPAILKLDELDHVVGVDDGDSIIMAQKLSQDLGLSVGISSGANFLGAVKLAHENPQANAVVTIFCDCNKKYFSTDYVKKIPVLDGFISSDIELVDFEVIAKK